MIYIFINIVYLYIPKIKHEYMIQEFVTFIANVELRLNIFKKYIYNQLMFIHKL